MPAQRRDDALLIQAHILIWLSYLLIFNGINRFMLERYASQLVIFILLYLPFILHALWRAGKRSLPDAWPRYLVIALPAGMSLDSLHNNALEETVVFNGGRHGKVAIVQMHGSPEDERHQAE